MSEFWELRYEILNCKSKQYRKQCLDAYTIECKKIMKKKFKPLFDEIEKLKTDIEMLEPYAKKPW